MNLRLREALAPLLFGVAVLLLWEGTVRLLTVPPYVLPGPVAIWHAFAEDWRGLLASLLVTLRITLAALLLSALLGGGLAVLLSQFRALEAAVLPWTVVLQVTPVVAIAPLVIIWVNDVTAALLVCATVVAFFPVLSNTTLGLRAVDRGLLDLCRTYGAGRWQVLWKLRLPAALPFFLAGLRISGGLSLIGAVVAEFVAGTGGNASGLAYRLLEAGFQLRIPRMFAALALISAAGVAIFALLSALGRFLLRNRTAA